MQSYKIKGYTLTPIHIGSGDVLDPLQYIMKDDVKDPKLTKMYVFDQQKFVASLPVDKQTEFVKLIDGDKMSELRSFIRTLVKIDSPAVLYQADVTQKIAEAYKLKIGERSLNNQLLINQFIRQPYSPNAYIPGSSVKGSIRTAVIDGLKNGLNLNSRLPANLIEARILDNIKTNNRGDETADIQRDPFRMVKIFDMQLPDDAMIVMRIENTSENSGQNSGSRYGENRHLGNQPSAGIPMQYEMAKKGVNFNGQMELMLHEIDKINKIADAGRKPSLKINKRIDLDTITKFCNGYYSRKLQNEASHFKKLPLLSEIYDALLSEMEEIQSTNNNKVMIRLGKFSQLEFVTLSGELRRPRTRDGKPYNYGKTRNIAEDYPPGWIVLEFIQEGC